MPGLSGDQIRKRLDEARLYLCTDARAERGDLAEFADAALAGGVDIIQLRDKTSGAPLEAKQELAALEVLAEACARHGALLAVNDRADVALAVDADVLHLGQDDLPVPVARRILGDGPVIGRSTHSVEQARAAEAEPGVDYFCTGPCWPTPTKPGKPRARPGPGACDDRGAAAVVRHRRHRRRAPARGARRRRFARRGGPRHHRGRRPAGRRAAAGRPTALTPQPLVGAALCVGLADSVGSALLCDCVC